MNSGDLGAPAFAWVTSLGAISGAASVLVFRRWTDNERLRQTANRIVAHLLEISLFAEEPRFVLRAQRDLIVENGRLLRQLARPSLFLVVPFAVLLATIDLFFGHVPLRPGETELVTVQFKSTGTTAHLKVPSGIEVDGPPVYIPVERQLVWQIHADSAAKGEAVLSTGETTIGKRITAGNGFSFVSAERGASLWHSLLHPGEWPFSSNIIDSIKIGYRTATVFHAHWLWWFGLSSVLGAGLPAVRRS